MKLLDLPADIINILPQYIDSIYDLYNVLLTCKTFHTAYKDSNAKLPPILPRPDGQFLFQPHPRLLLTVVARQIGDWAVSSHANRYKLYQSLLHGYEGLLSLAECVALVSLSDLQRLHDVKYSLLNPLTRLVDFEVGPAMVRNQEIDPAEYGLTICEHPDIAVLNYIVYCELFHHYVDDILSSPDGISPPKPLEPGIRHRFIAYCLPDKNNHRHREYKSLGKPGRNDEWQLLDFIQMSQSTAVTRRDEAFRRYWETGILQTLPEEENIGLGGHAWDWTPTTAEKSEQLFKIVAGHLGWFSLKMLLLDGLAGESLRRTLEGIKTKIQGIPKEVIDKWEYWSEGDDTVSEIPLDGLHHEMGWKEWMGLASDCHEGIGTNGASDEEIQIEQKACESLLKLAMSAQQLGIIETHKQTEE